MFIVVSRSGECIAEASADQGTSWKQQVLDFAIAVSLADVEV